MINMTPPIKTPEWERELSRMRRRKEFAEQGLCATCGDDHTLTDGIEMDNYTHGFDDGSDALCWNETIFISSLLSSIAEEVDKQNKDVGGTLGFDAGLALASSLIRGHIKK